MRNSIINYIRKSGVLFEKFDDPIEWTAANANISGNTEYVRKGNQSLEITTNNQVKCLVKKTVSVNLFDDSTIEIGFYIPNISTVSDIYVHFSEDNSFLHTFVMHYFVDELVEGWNYIQLHKNYLTGTEGSSWGNNTIRLGVEITPITGQNTTVIFDHIILNQEILPRCAFTFDDGNVTDYTVAFPYMEEKGIKGTVFIIPGQIDNPNTLNLTQLGELYDAGWLIANHTFNHYDLTTLSLENAELEIVEARDWINDNGFVRGDGGNILAYPYGKYNYDIINLLEEIGVKSARGGMVIDYTPNILNINRHYTQPITGLYQTAPDASTHITRIQRSKLSGNSIIPTIHKLIEVPVENEEYSITNFELIVDYVVSSGLKSVTMDELHFGLTNSRYVSIPVQRGVVSDRTPVLSRSVV